MKTTKWIAAGLVTLAALVSGVSHAQGGDDSFSSFNLATLSDQTGVLPLSGTNFMMLRSWSNDQLTILAGALGEVPTIQYADLPKNRMGMTMGGTFWSLQQMAPFPSDPAGVDVWQMADGSFLLDDLNFDYGALSANSMGKHAMGSGLSGPVSFGDGGGTFRPEDRTNSIPVPQYGTNLWIAQTAVASGYLTGIGSNTLPGVSYTIQSFTDMTQVATGWQNEGAIVGSGLTNWTPLSVPQNNRTNLFIRLRSELSSEGSGIPNWWEALYFGTNAVNPDAQDSAGDGYTIYQKYEMGVPPGTFITPPAPQGFSVCYNSTAANVTLSWQPSQGKVTGYTLIQFDPYRFTYWAWGLPTNTTTYVDNYPVTYFIPEYGEPTYSIYATYSLGQHSVTNTLTMFNPSTSVSAQIVQGTQGHNELLVQGALPVGTTSLLLTCSDFDWDTFAYTESSYSVPANSLTNNTAVLPDDWFDSPGIVDDSEDWFVQTVGSNGSVSDMTLGDALWWSQGYQSPTPFLDGRQQLVQNASFLLRVANAYWPFNYSYSDGAYAGNGYWYPMNYSYAGLYDVTGISQTYYYYYYGSPNPVNNLDQFRPFVENFFFHNFVLSTNDLDPTTGCLTTGLGMTVDAVPQSVFWPWNYYYYANVTMSSQPSYQFQWWDTNSTIIPAILSPAQTTWTCCFPQSEPDIGYPTPDSLSSYGVSGSDGNYSMTTPAANIFGLPFLSARFAYNANGTFQTPVLEAGRTISGVTNGGFFSQTAVPQLKTVDYYFAQPASYPLPGQYTFSTDLPNNTNNLVAGFGQSALFAGYAKQVLLNGYTNVYSYLGQYFDEAYQIDSNGSVTTNSAGLISPYGEFVATAVGPVALVTMTNWGVNERGTGIVHVVKLVLDVNHDGTMDLTANGPDNTSANSPYVFWANNNYDRWDHDGSFFNPEQDDQEAADCPAYGAMNTPDFNYSNFVSDGFITKKFRAIPCTRDLEDFARFWICGMTTNLIAALPQGSTVTLSWGDVGNPNSSNPTIDLFMAADSDGGVGYQTNETVATLQTNAVQSPYIGRLRPGQSIQLSSFDNNGNPTWLGNYFIWCGVSNGTGGLTLTIADGNGNVLAQTTAYIQIVDIKQMYERWTVGDNSQVPPMRSAILAPDYPTNSMKAPFQYSQPPNTITPYILDVHGYNMQVWEKDRFAETAYKRLYWQGYQGRFGAFNWPTAAHALEFGSSEAQAWNSAQGLLNKLNDLNEEYPGHVYLMAHSLGNVIAGEALRLAGSTQVVNTYVAMQGAVSAHAYDPTTTKYTLTDDWGAPDCYAHYWTNGAPCYFNSSVGAGTYVTFYNTNDWALSGVWLLFQNSKPVLDLNYSFVPPDFYYKNSGSTELFFPGNTYELFDEIIQSRSYALGMQPNVGGSFLTGTNYNQISLPNVWPPDTSGNNYGAHIWHSAEFRSDNSQRWQFWNEVLVKMKLKTP